MSRIDELIERLCPDGVEYKTLGEVGTFTRGSGIQKKDFVDEGVGCIHYGQIYTSYGLFADKTLSFISPDFAKGKRMAKQDDLVIATTSENEEDVCKAVAWLGNEEIAVSNDAYIFSHSLNPKYMAYFFQSNLFQTQKRSCITGTKVLRVSGDSMAKFRIPVPPMEIQEEIVRILDSFSELEAELEAELGARAQQYRFFRNRLLNSDSSSPACNFKLGEVVSINKGTYITKREVSPGKIPVVLGGTEPAYWHAEANHLGEGIVVSRSGANAGFVSYWNEPIFVSDGFVLDSKPGISLRYIYHALKNKQDKLHAMKRGSGVPHIQRKALSEFVISIPPLEEQRRIVSILDKFDALVNDLSSGIPAEIEARRKQYEYYRDKLLTFKEKPGD